MYEEIISKGNLTAMHFIDGLNRVDDTRPRLLTAIRKILGAEGWRAFPELARPFVQYALNTPKNDSVAYRALGEKYFQTAISQSMTSNVTQQIADSWAGIIREAHVARTLARPLPLNGDGNMLQLLNKRVMQLSELTQTAPDACATFDVIGLDCHKIIDLWQTEGRAARGLDTGIPPIDTVFNEGQITIIAASTNEGKSFVTGVICQNVARKGGRVLVFTRDMSKEDYFIRLACREAGMSLTKIRDNKAKNYYDKKEMAYFHSCIDTVRKLPLTVNDSPACGIAEVQAMFTRAEGAVDLAVFDYATLYLSMVSARHDVSGYETLYAKIQEAIRQVSPTTRILINHQFNRRKEDKDCVPRLERIEYGGEKLAYGVIGMIWPWGHIRSMSDGNRQLFGLDRPAWAKTNDPNEWITVYEDDPEREKLQREWRKAKQSQLYMWVLKNRGDKAGQMIKLKTKIGCYDIEEISYDD